MKTKNPTVEEKLSFDQIHEIIAVGLEQGSATCGSKATCGSLNPRLWLLLEVNKDLFLGNILGIRKFFAPDDSFVAPAGFRIITTGLIWLFKCKRLPTLV